MSVGCSLTNSARNDANSEYLRFTSRPYSRVNSMKSPSSSLTYTTIDGVLYVVHTILPRARDQHKLIRVLVQPLFYARIVTTLLRRLGVCMVLLFLVVVDAVHVPLRDILGRLLCGGRSLGGRSRRTIRDLIMLADDAGDYFR